MQISRLTAGLLALGLFASTLFAADTYCQDLVSASWQKIRVLEGNFTPTLDLLSSYKDKAGAKAIDQDGQLPDVATGGKLPTVDTRIAAEAQQERQLHAPPTFGSN